jgi:hypothetical protein
MVHLSVETVDLSVETVDLSVETVDLRVETVDWMDADDRFRSASEVCWANTTGWTVWFAWWRYTPPKLAASLAWVLDF